MSSNNVGGIESLNVVHTTYLLTIGGILVCMPCLVCARARARCSRCFAVLAYQILTAICIVRFRHMKQMRAMKKIPRSRVPVGRRDVPGKCAGVIAAALERSLTMKHDPVELADGQLGWGNSSSEFAKVHFKTSIAKSYLVLETAAERKHPRLVRQPDMTVRDFVQMLQLNCVGMDGATCERFLHAYEAARFAPDDVDLAAYLAFREAFVALIEALDGAALSTAVAAGAEPVVPERWVLR